MGSSGELELPPTAQVGSTVELEMPQTAQVVFSVELEPHLTVKESTVVSWMDLELPLTVEIESIVAPSVGLEFPLPVAT